MKATDLFLDHGMPMNILDDHLGSFSLNMDPFNRLWWAPALKNLYSMCQ